MIFDITLDLLLRLKRGRCFAGPWWNPTPAEGATGYNMRCTCDTHYPCTRSLCHIGSIRQSRAAHAASARSRCDELTRTNTTNAIGEFTADSRGFVKSSQGINSNIRRIREWVRNGFATGSQMSSRRIRENVHSVHNGFARIRKRVHNGFARVCIWVHDRFARIVKTIRRCYTVHRACT